jgi:hypothetical protein
VRGDDGHEQERRQGDQEVEGPAYRKRQDSNLRRSRCRRCCACLLDESNRIPPMTSVKLTKQVGPHRAAGTQLSEDEARGKRGFPHEPVTLFARSWAPAEIADEALGIVLMLGRDLACETRRTKPLSGRESRRGGSPFPLWLWMQIQPHLAPTDRSCRHRSATGP